MTDLRWMDEERAAWEAAGTLRSLTPRGATATPYVEIDGTRLVSFASNDYLGLAADGRVVEAAIEAARRYGWGAGAAPLITGWTDEHAMLAEELARFEGVEAATVFPTGFAANVGAIAALVSRGDLVLLDRLAHGSLVAGARLSGARVRVFTHNDADRLDAILKRECGGARRVLIVTESLFSMDGDVAPLCEMAEIAGRHDAMLLVDEAHATGVFGEGRGLVHALGIGGAVTLRVGTLSKALGSIGGFVAGPRRVVERVWRLAGTFLFSTSLPASAAAAARAALRIVGSEPERAGRLGERSRQLIEGLRSRGWMSCAAGPIVPVVVGEADRAMALSRQLREHGLHVPAIRPPTVPRGTARLRISMSAMHEANHIERLVEAIGNGRLE